MRKSQLIKALQDATASGDHTESIGLSLLSEFLDVPTIAQRYDNQDVHFYEFSAFMSAMGKDHNDIFSASYLKNNNPLARFFCQFIAEDFIEIKKTKTKKPTPHGQNIFSLDSLTNDGAQVVLTFLDDRTMARLATSCKNYYNETGHFIYWKEKLIIAGCNEELLENVISAGVIKNYKNLFLAFNKIPRGLRKDISMPWELYCLSSEIPAIQYAIINEKLTHETQNKHGDNALHFIARNGTPNAMRFVKKELNNNPSRKNKYGLDALLISAVTGNIPAIDCAYQELKISETTTTTDNSNLMHMAILSGNISTVEHVKKLFENSPCNTVNADGENFLHFAVRSGSLRMVNYILSNYDINPKSINNDGDNILHIAASSGFTDIMKYAITTLHLESNSLNKAGYNALLLAAKHGELATLKYCIEDLQIPSESTTYEKSNLLHLTAISGVIKVVNYVCQLSSFKLAPTKTNIHDRTAYDFANKSSNPNEINKALKQFELRQNSQHEERVSRALMS